jgi:hypothetical protein
MVRSRTERTVPAHPRHTIQAGSRSRSILVYAADAADPAMPKSGLVADAAGAGASAIRVGEEDPYNMRLTRNTIDSFIPGGWVEVDRELAPGVYRFGIPNAVLGEGASHVMIAFRFPGATIDPVELMLVAYDPQEAERIGMECQVWEERQAFLRQGLAGLAEMELALQDEARAHRAAVKAALTSEGSEA